MLAVTPKVTNDYVRQQRNDLTFSHDYISIFSDRTAIVADAFPLELNRAYVTKDELKISCQIQKHKWEIWKSEKPKDFFLALAKPSFVEVELPFQESCQFELTNLHFPNVEIFPTELWTDVDVSINYVTPIGKSAANGKSYRQTESNWEQKGFIDDDEQPSDSTGGRKAYRQRKDRLGDTRQTQSIWDLIFPSSSLP